MRLAELIDFNPRTALPKAGAVPFIDMAALPTMGRDISFVGERPASSSGSKFRNGDTLLARITPCLENGKGAKIAGLPSEGIGHGSTEFIVLRAKLKSDENFVYYLSRHPNFRAFAIQQMSGTSGRQRVSWQPLADFEIQNLDVQDRAMIGDTLSLLDDKINLNRRMNKTLEGMAQAIFRDWFVDFGPVRRKAAGEADPVAIMGGLTPDPARAAELAALFPAALGNDGLPVGWTERPLDTIADFLNGLALQKFPAKAGEPDLPVIKIAELRNGLSERTNRAARTLPAKYIIKDGDFIFSWSGSLMAKVWTLGEGALNQHLFKVSSNEFPQWFYGQWVHDHMPEFQLIAASKATTMGHIQRGHLASATTVCPQEGAIEVMSSVMQPLWDRMIHNELESRTLAETRDYLLPRLMSGAVRVSPKGEAA